MAARVEESTQGSRASSRLSSRNTAQGGDLNRSTESPASSSQRLTPSRLRRRTLGDDDDLAAERRSSLISQTEAPVPAIPARFLDSSPRLQRRAHNIASPRYSREEHVQKGDILPASSPLAYDFSDSATLDSSPPLRASPSKRSLLPAVRNGVAKPWPQLGFAAPDESPTSTLQPGTPRSASYHTRAASLPTSRFTNHLAHTRAPSKHQATLEALTGQDASMDHTQPDANEDLFMQLAEDSASTDGEPTLTQRAVSRSSWHDKRHQQTGSTSARAAPENGRPRTTERLAGRPSSRFTTHIDTSRANRSLKTPGPEASTNFTSPRYGEITPSSAQHRRANLFSDAPECSPRTSSRYYDRGQSPEKSPELPTFGRRRPSFGYPHTASHSNHRGSHLAKPQESEGDSPANSSEAKRSGPESDSVDSQTAPSTVWDELDDLKSRIKKLELTGKIPSTSSAAVVGGGTSSERPRTATTAPTTISSSPKQQRKPEGDARGGAQGPKSPVDGPLTIADIHPTLHAALAKAKALLSASLYRTLDATATDALQLVAMTGSAGPQGTTYSAASIINGATVSDRQIRRKADMMCRNLTDLCLALCEGKHEAPSMVSAPIGIDTPPRITGPRSKYSRSSLAFGEDLSKIASRPMSRLDARRSSILGIQPSNDPQASGDDVSISEHETTPSQPHRVPETRRQSRLSNRLEAPRFGRYEEASGDEDVRPPSRAMTEVGNFGSPYQHSSPRDYNFAAMSAMSKQQSHRSPSLRESLSARRVNAAAHETNREVSRVASLNLDPSRRRFARDSTPPVMEEEANEQDTISQKRRRITSFSQRRAVELGPNRSTSLSHRRPNIMVE